MSKKIAVKFCDDNNNIHQLRYKIYDSGIANKWLSILDKNLTLTNHYIHSFFMNKTEKEFPLLMKEMNSISEIINKNYDRKLPYFENETFLNQDILNMLHEEYEIYGDRIEDLILKEQFDEEIHNQFLRLNEIIHSCETILENIKKQFYPMSVLIDFYPQEIYDSICEIDKLYLTNSFRWGGLYLGYNTLGKDWLEISNHNDIDVILRNQVRPQKRFSAESWFYFSGDALNCNPTIRFEKWYNSLSDNIKKQVPIDNLNELTFGRFEIGTVIIDKHFLNFHNCENDWLTPNHPIKNKWNIEVFSTFKKVIDIRAE